MAFRRGPQIVKDGLVMYLDAANTKSYPGTGTVWKDLSGYGNDGVIIDGGFSNNYLHSLSVDSGYFSIDVTHSETLEDTFSKISGGWVIEEVIMTESDVYPAADAGSVISTSAHQSTNIGFDWNHSIQTHENFRTMNTHYDGATLFRDDVYITLPPGLNSLNIWKVRTMVWDRSNNKFILFWNGEYIGEVGLPNTVGKSLYDGGGIRFGTLYGWRHVGKRSTIKVYDRILSSEEIAQNFHTTKSRFGL